MKNKTWLLCVLIMSNLCSAMPTCHYTPELGQQTLNCYLKQPEHSHWELKRSTVQPEHAVTVFEYQLTSLVWPPIDVQTNHWRHTLKVTIPDTVRSRQALLFIGKGMRQPNTAETTSQDIDLSAVAAKTQTVVAELDQVPNQCLTFADDRCYVGDGLVAISWQRFLTEPTADDALPIHFPMVKSAVIAMDAIQAILSERGTPVEHFTLVGKSKRGWAAWLTALHDQRVNALITVVADFVDTQATVEHIIDVYGGYPQAMRPFKLAGIDELRKTPAYQALMSLEDPLAYLPLKEFAPRFDIPKVFISASGDDFTVPDTVARYIDKIPGKNSLRLLANSPHYVDEQLTAELIESYYQALISDQPIPELTWNLYAETARLEITASTKPVRVTLFYAENPEAEDFRFNEGIRYHSKPIEVTIDNHYEIDLHRPLHGYCAQYVEFQFQAVSGERIVLTTAGMVLKATTTQ